MVKQQLKHWRNGVPRIQVYPPREVFEVLPPRRREQAARLHEALSCWARQIAEATRQLDGVFDPAEWGLLALALAGVPFEPRWHPGPNLALAVEDWVRAAGDPLKVLPGLANRLRDLSYEQAWAVVLAVRFYHDHLEELAATDAARNSAWWTLAVRKAVLAGKE